MIYTVFPFLPVTDQRIFLFCLIRGLRWKRFPLSRAGLQGWLSFTPRAAPPQQPRRGPYGRSGLHLRISLSYLRDAGSRKMPFSALHRDRSFCIADPRTSRQFLPSLDAFSTLWGDYGDKHTGIGKHEQCGEFRFAKETESCPKPPHAALKRYVDEQFDLAITSWESGFSGHDWMMLCRFLPGAKRDRD